MRCLDYGRCTVAEGDLPPLVQSFRAQERNAQHGQRGSTKLTWQHGQTCRSSAGEPRTSISQLVLHVARGEELTVARTSNGKHQSSTTDLVETDPTTRSVFVGVALFPLRSS